MRLLKIFKRMLAFLVRCFNVTYMCNLLRDAFNMRNLLRDAFNMRNLLRDAFNKKSFQLEIPIGETRDMTRLKFIRKITKFQTGLKKSLKDIVFLFFSHGTHDRSSSAWHCIVDFFSDFIIDLFPDLLPHGIS